MFLLASSLQSSPASVPPIKMPYETARTNIVYKKEKPEKKTGKKHVLLTGTSNGGNDIRS